MKTGSPIVINKSDGEWLGFSTNAGALKKFVDEPSSPFINRPLDECRPDSLKRQENQNL